MNATPHHQVAVESIRQAAIYPEATHMQLCHRVATALGLPMHDVTRKLADTPAATTHAQRSASRLPPDSPQLSGPMGRAWRMDLARINPGKTAGATIDMWLIHAPFAHAQLPYYMLMCIHLRKTPGMAPAKVMKPGATHECMLTALLPEQRLRLDAVPTPLHPINYMGQFVAPTDARARARIEGAVTEIVTGELCPDADHHQDWIARFGDSNVIRNHHTTKGARP